MATTYVKSPTGDANRDPSYARAEVVEIPGQWSVVENPWQLVSDRFAITAEYADGSYKATIDYQEELMAMIKGLEDFEVGEIDVDLPTVGDIDYDARPSVGDLDLDENWPSNTAEKPYLYPLPALTLPVFPVLTAQPPDIVLPDRVQPSEIPGPGDAPIIRQIDVPIAPPIVMPQAPQFSEVVLPTPPVITLPEFDSNLPEDVIGDPERLEWEENPYNSDIWATLLDKARTGIIEGGTGLAPEVEQAIWDRALSRQQIENDKSYREIETYFSSRGFEIPAGSMGGRLQEKGAEIERNNLDLNRDIMNKQAELAQTNTHFMLEYGRQAELILREFHNAQANRSLDAAKAVAANSIEILNALVNRYNIKIEKYKADATVFGERVKAALVSVEIFKSQVESAQVSVEVQKALADLYGKQVDAVNTIVNIYTAEMEGAKVSAEIESLRIQGFRERVQAFVAQIDAEKVKYDAYNSAVEGEKVKAELYSEQVNAFVAEVQASKVIVEAEDTVVKSVNLRNISEIERYKAELLAYTTEIEAEAKRIGALVTGFEGEVAGYVAETGAEEAKLKAKVAEIGARIEEGKLNVQVALAEIESSTQGYIAIKELQIKGTDGVMGVSAQLAASAMNAVSASASYGYSGNESKSNSFSQTANSTEQHSFSHPTRQLS